MKNLSNTEAELKKSLAYKKKICVCQGILIKYLKNLETDVIFSLLFNNSISLIISINNFSVKNQLQGG